jgi:hypothetical protein
MEVSGQLYARALYPWGKSLWYPLDMMMMMMMMIIIIIIYVTDELHEAESFLGS